MPSSNLVRGAFAAAAMGVFACAGSYSPINEDPRVDGNSNSCDGANCESEEGPGGDAAAPCTNGEIATCNPEAEPCDMQVRTCVGGVWSECTDATPPDETCNLVDDDCDGEIDEGCDVDGDGYCNLELGGACDDCDDLNPYAFPGATELCDGDDNNCNGMADDACSDLAACATDGTLQVQVLPSAETSEGPTALIVVCNAPPPGAGAFTLDLFFDALAVDPIGATSLLGSDWLPIWNLDYDPGIARFVGINAYGQQGSFPMFTVEFVCLAAGVTPLDMVVTTFADAKGNDFPTPPEAIGGTIACPTE